jgi:hypothetical protein
VKDLLALAHPRVVKLSSPLNLKHNIHICNCFQNIVLPSGRDILKRQTIYLEKAPIQKGEGGTQREDIFLL